MSSEMSYSFQSLKKNSLHPLPKSPKSTPNMLKQEQNASFIKNRAESRGSKFNPQLFLTSVSRGPLFTRGFQPLLLTFVLIFTLVVYGRLITFVQN